MKKKSPVLVIITGMAITHLFFTWMVYRENLNLYHNMRLIIEAGYLPVPNAHILPSFTKFGTAFKGAVFYTLTAGIILPFLVYLAAWAWDRIYRRNRIFLIILSGFVVYCMVMLNRHGFNPIVTFWFLTIYITVFKLTLYGLDDLRTSLSIRRLFTHLAVLAVLGATAMTTPGIKAVSLSVRDHLLLSNPVGQRITDFYYRYSPYPTNAYTPLQKKNLKTCRIEGRVDNTLKQRRLKALLLKRDYLPVVQEAESDVLIRITDNRLSFSVDDRTVLRTDIDTFLQSPKDALARISSRSDRNNFTRRILAISITVLPVFLYACLFAIFQLIFSRLPGPVSGFWLSAGGCLLVGVAVLIGIRFMSFSAIPESDLKNVLASDSPDLRVAALRTISRQNLDPSDYLGIAPATLPTYVPERIWWAISLGNSTAPGTNDLLVKLLDDPHPLVACKAYSSIGRRKYRAAVPAIIEKLEASRHWYVQGYAYNALRTLGWKQTASN